MRYKLFIFDLDGTLVDTSPGIMETVRQVEKSLNIPPIPEEQLRGFIGPPLEDSFQRYSSTPASRRHWTPSPPPAGCRRWRR